MSASFVSFLDAQSNFPTRQEGRRLKTEACRWSFRRLRRRVLVFGCNMEVMAVDLKDVVARVTPGSRIAPVAGRFLLDPASARGPGKARGCGWL